MAVKLHVEFERKISPALDMGCASITIIEEQLNPASRCKGLYSVEKGKQL